MVARHPSVRDHQIVASSIRLAWRLADAPVRWLWRRLAPLTVGARAIIQNDEGQILLVHRAIDQRWYLPGGGVHRGETLLDAAAREVREETGIIVSLEGAGIFGVYSSLLEGKSDHIVVFTCPASGAVRPDGIEIDAAAYWLPDGLPDNVSPGTARRLTELAACPATPIAGIW